MLLFLRKKIQYVSIKLFSEDLGRFSEVLVLNYFMHYTISLSIRLAYGHFGKDIKFKTTTAIGKAHHDTQNRKNKKTQNTEYIVFFSTHNHSILKLRQPQNASKTITNTTTTITNSGFYLRLDRTGQLSPRIGRVDLRVRLRDPS